jgi:hypothetical protein
MSKARHYDVCPCPINTHLYLGTGGTLGDTCVQQAEREAKRILAETEPTPPRPRCDDPRCWCYIITAEHSNIGRPLAMCSPMYAALADALRAFVEGE